MILLRLSESRSGTALSSRTLSRNRWILRAQYRTGRGEPGDPARTGERSGLVDVDGLRWGGGCGCPSLSCPSFFLSPSVLLLPYGSSDPKPKSPTSDPSSLATCEVCADERTVHTKMGANKGVISERSVLSLQRTIAPRKNHRSHNQANVARGRLALLEAVPPAPLSLLRSWTAFAPPVPMPRVTTRNG